MKGQIKILMIALVTVILLSVTASAYHFGAIAGYRCDDYDDGRCEEYEEIYSDPDEYDSSDYYFDDYGYYGYNPYYSGGEYVYAGTEFGVGIHDEDWYANDYYLYVPGRAYVSSYRPYYSYGYYDNYGYDSDDYYYDYYYDHGAGHYNYGEYYPSSYACYHGHCRYYDSEYDYVQDRFFDAVYFETFADYNEFRDTTFGAPSGAVYDAEEYYTEDVPYSNWRNKVKYDPIMGDGNAYPDGNYYYEPRYDPQLGYYNWRY